MEQFLKVAKNITRCTYTPNEKIEDVSLFIDPENMKGTPVSRCPIEVRKVDFLPRSVYEPIAQTQAKTDEAAQRVLSRASYKAVLEIAFAPDEHIFGLGQDEEGALEKRGRIEHLCHFNMRVPIPMFVSSLGYGVLFNCACLMIFDDTADVCRITLECADQLDFYVIEGGADEIVAGYRFLTGRAAPMPSWVMGYWQSKERYQTQNELVETAKKYRDLGVPLDVIVQDWFTWVDGLWGDKHLDKERYPDFPSAVRTLHDMDVHCMISVWPNLAVGGRDRAEFEERGMLLGNNLAYNAFDPEARALYFKQAEEELYSAGIDGWWCDSTEPFSEADWWGAENIPENERYERLLAEHEKYIDPLVTNAYALMHAKGIFENQPRKPVVNLTRSGWAGIQKYGAILWAGDTAATWKELKREIAKGLNLAISGIPYWAVDAGAFFVKRNEPWFWRGDYEQGVADKGYQELYTRWLQFACFLPVFRSHGTETPREVWHFEEPFRGAIEKTIRLRYRLLPYVKEMYRKVHQEHYTIMRSLFFDFPNDKKALSVDDQFMFGSDLLICPVYEPQMYAAESTPIDNAACERACYLPEGCDWYDFYTGERYNGGQTVCVKVTINEIPVFVKAGAEIPVTEDAIVHAEQAYEVKLLRYGK